MSSNYARRRAIRKHMSETGENWTTAARAVDAAAEQRRRPAPEPEVWPILTGLPTVQVADVEDDEDNLPSYARLPRYGRIERTTTGWLITPGAAESYAREQPLVRVDYRDPETWEPRFTELPPVVRALPFPSGDRWVWACNGWAVDEPGDIAEPAVKASPSSELPYAVRTFELIRRDGVYPLDWIGSSPYWHTLAWCHDLDVALALAEGSARRKHANTARAQVVGPDEAGGRKVLFSIDSTAELRATDPPSRPYGALPSMPRPVAPPPTHEPVWDNTEIDDRDRPRYNIRAWSPDTGWSTLLWTSCRQYAAIAARCLLVGVTEEPYPYGDGWGPKWRKTWDTYGESVISSERDGYALMDHYPDEGFEERTARYRAS